MRLIMNKTNLLTVGQLQSGLNGLHLDEAMPTRATNRYQNQRSPSQKHELGKLHYISLQTESVTTLHALSGLAPQHPIYQLLELGDCHNALTAYGIECLYNLTGVTFELFDKDGRECVRVRGILLGLGSS